MLRLNVERGGKHGGRKCLRLCEFVSKILLLILMSVSKHILKVKVKDSLIKSVRNVQPHMNPQGYVIFKSWNETKRNDLISLWIRGESWLILGRNWLKMSTWILASRFSMNNDQNDDFNWFGFTPPTKQFCLISRCGTTTFGWIKQNVRWCALTKI